MRITTAARVLVLATSAIAGCKDRTKSVTSAPPAAPVPFSVASAGAEDASARAAVRDPRLDPNGCIAKVERGPIQRTAWSPKSRFFVHDGRLIDVAMRTTMPIPPGRPTFSSDEAFVAVVSAVVPGELSVMSTSPGSEARVVARGIVTERLGTYEQVLTFDATGRWLFFHTPCDSHVVSVASAEPSRRLGPVAVTGFEAARDFVAWADPLAVHVLDVRTGSVVDANVGGTADVAVGDTWVASRGHDRRLEVRDRDLAKVRFSLSDVAQIRASEDGRALAVVMKPADTRPDDVPVRMLDPSTGKSTASFTIRGEESIVTPGKPPPRLAGPCPSTPLELKKVTAATVTLERLCILELTYDFDVKTGDLRGTTAHTPSEDEELEQSLAGACKRAKLTPCKMAGGWYVEGRIASLSRPEGLVVFDVPRAKVIAVLEDSKDDHDYPLVPSPNGKYGARVGMPTIDIWDAANGKKVLAAAYR